MMRAAVAAFRALDSEYSERGSREFLVRDNPLVTHEALDAVATQELSQALGAEQVVGDGCRIDTESAGLADLLHLHLRPLDELAQAARLDVDDVHRDVEARTHRATKVEARGARARARAASRAARASRGDATRRAPRTASSGRPRAGGIARARRRSRARRTVRARAAS